ncbi:MAG: hypothetical protein IJQ01_08595 [Selenomonadaceae bacterium]|nr:hypothetical protein [Selenomonadaceae bacterium]MBR0103539.1 hypothetical protein [Selenomonadaceae bacterium]
MFRKVLAGAMILAGLLIVGCGGADKVVGSPDKAILAYSELVTMGESPNMAAAGFSEEDNKNLRKMMIKVFEASFNGIVPLSEQSADDLANVFYNSSKARIKFQAALKTDDAERPVVELTTTPFNMTDNAAAFAPNDELIALIGMVGKLKSDGATDEQLKSNPEVQKLAVEVFGKYLKELPLQPEMTCAVVCKKVTGTDGNTHWAPDDVNALMDFITLGKLADK